MKGEINKGLRHATGDFAEHTEIFKIVLCRNDNLNRTIDSYMFEAVDRDAMKRLQKRESLPEHSAIM